LFDPTNILYFFIESRGSLKKKSPRRCEGPPSN